MLQGGAISAEARALWEQLFEDISQFEDFREGKTGMAANAPDFKHRKSGDGLWWVYYMQTDDLANQSAM